MYTELASTSPSPEGPIVIALGNVTWRKQTVQFFQGLLDTVTKLIGGDIQRTRVPLGVPAQVLPPLIYRPNGTRLPTSQTHYQKGHH